LEKKTITIIENKEYYPTITTELSTVNNIASHKSNCPDFSTCLRIVIYKLHFIISDLLYKVQNVNLIDTSKKIDRNELNFHDDL